MPRRKTRLTLKKKHKETKRPSNPDNPSEDDWNEMRTYHGFVIQDEAEGVKHTFKKGASALIQQGTFPSTEIPLHEYWVGKIREIRQDAVGDVWAKVQWDWSGMDVNAYIKSFDDRKCGKFERIFSDQYDYVSSECFDGLVKVYHYDETNLEQEDIEEDEFYSRYDLEYSMRSIKPRPLATCICKKSYNPDFDTMHLCPRPSCRRSYHRTCLIRSGFIEDSSSDTSLKDLPLKLLTSSPDIDDPFDVTRIIQQPGPPPKRRVRARQVSNPKPNPQIPGPVTKGLNDLLEDLPAELVQVASLPIVKGVGAGGVVGNVASVIMARRMIYKAVGVEEEPIPHDWDETVDTSVLDYVAVQDYGTSMPALRCPGCNEPI